MGAFILANVSQRLHPSLPSLEGSLKPRKRQVEVLTQESTVAPPVLAVIVFTSYLLLFEIFCCFHGRGCEGVLLASRVTVAESQAGPISATNRLCIGVGSHLNWYAAAKFQYLFLKWCI